MEIFLLMLALLAGNVIQGITGFAGTIIVMPFSILLVGLNASRSVLNVIGVGGGFSVAVANRKHIQWKQLLKIVLWMGLGMGIGVLIEQYVPAKPLTVAYGIFLILIAGFKLLFPKPMPLPKGVGELILVCAGVIHALFVSGGSLLVLYAALAFPKKQEFRATLSSVWVVLNSIMFVRHLAAGYFTPEVWTITALAVMPVALGILIGTKLQKKLKQEAFMTLTYCLLIVCGLVVLFG